MAGKRVRVHLRKIDLRIIDEMLLRFDRVKNQSDAIREALALASSKSDIAIMPPSQRGALGRDTSIVLGDDDLANVERIRDRCPVPISRNHAIREALRIAAHRQLDLR